MATSHQDGLDPTDAQTPEAFMELLRQARAASGLSLVEVADRATQRGYDIDPFDLATALQSLTLPRWQVITGVLTACGLNGMQIDRWMRVYHDLAAPPQPVIANAPAAQQTVPTSPSAPTANPPAAAPAAPASPAKPKPVAPGGPLIAPAPTTPASAAPAASTAPTPATSTGPLIAPPPITPPSDPPAPLAAPKPAAPGGPLIAPPPAVPTPSASQPVVPFTPGAPPPPWVPLAGPASAPSTTTTATAPGAAAPVVPRPRDAPDSRSGPGEPATAVQDGVDAKPVSVPPLILSTADPAPTRFGRRRLAIAGGALAALILLPLLAFALFSGGPENVAAQVTTGPPRKVVVAPPAPALSDMPTADPSPTAVVPTTPAPATTTTKPPPPSPVPPSPQQPSPQPSVPPSPADPGVLRSGVVGLTGNQGFDLDSGQIGGERDISRVNGTTLSRANGSLLEPMGAMPSKQTCQAEQGWETRVDDLFPGQWLCVRTSDGRFARLNVTAVGTTLKLVYTVWN